MRSDVESFSAIRICQTCDLPLDEAKRADARFCSGTCKQRAYRRRADNDTIVVAPVPADRDMRDTLIEARYLPAWDERNPAAVAAAIVAAFEVLKRNVG